MLPEPVERERLVLVKRPVKKPIKDVAAASLSFATVLGALEVMWGLANGWSANWFHVATYLVALAAFLVAALVAAALMFGIGLPALRILRNLAIDEPWEICATAAILGTFPVLVMWGLSTERGFPTVQFLIFALAGLIAGMVFVGRTYVVQIKKSEDPI